MDLSSTVHLSAVLFRSIATDADATQNTVGRIKKVWVLAARTVVPLEIPARSNAMSEVGVMLNLMEFVRTRTIGTLDEIAKQPDPAAVLRWQPGTGRAHLGWQLTHIGITEELTATERLKGTVPAYADLAPRFKVGSVPDDNVPDVATIREILVQSRAHLIATLSQVKDEELEVVPPWYTERGWTYRRILQILVWHESHHQGQAHLTLNLWKANHPA